MVPASTPSAPPAADDVAPRGGRSRDKADRRRLLLGAAAVLFAERGFHGVSMEEIGAAGGVSGPALYRHFAGKQEILAELLVGVSERLLAGGRAVVAAAGSDAGALRGLVAFHTDFALGEPELIRIQDRDLSSLTEEQSRLVRRLQRAYVEVWVAVLLRLDPGRTPAGARSEAHATFGLLNSTPHSAARRRETAAVRRLLEEMALAALLRPA